MPPRDPSRRSGGARALRILTIALVVVLGGGAVLVLAAPLLLGAVLSLPPRPSGALEDGVADRVRDTAYRLRNEDVRAALDGDASLRQVASLTGTARVHPALLRADDGERLATRGVVLLGAEPVGEDGSAITVALGGTFQTRRFLSDVTTPWVACLRVELPATAADATRWALADATCPAFSPGLRRDAQRIHASDLPVQPLLRRPCFSGADDCPGG